MKFTDEQLTKALEARAGSIEDVARDLGVTVPAVAYRVKQLKMPEASRRVGGRWKSEPVSDEAFVRAVANASSWGEVVKEIGGIRQTHHQRAARLGVQLGKEKSPREPSSVVWTPSTRPRFRSRGQRLFFERVVGQMSLAEVGKNVNMGERSLSDILLGASSLAAASVTVALTIEAAYGVPARSWVEPAKASGQKLLVARFNFKRNPPDLRVTSRAHWPETVFTRGQEMLCELLIGRANRRVVGEHLGIANLHPLIVGKTGPSLFTAVVLEDGLGISLKSWVEPPRHVDSTERK